MEKTEAPTLKQRYRGCLVGLAAGDAKGTTVEYASPGSFSPVTDMAGGGPALRALHYRAWLLGAGRSRETPGCGRDQGTCLYVHLVRASRIIV